MKTLCTNHRDRGMLWGGILLATLTLLSVDVGGVDDAQAGKRHRGRGNGPDVTIDIQHRNGPRGVLPGGCVQPAPLTRRDHTIAKRLAHRTGYRKGRLLKMRARGLSWYQIGNRLEIHPRVVRHAMKGWRGQVRSRDNWRWRARFAWDW